MGGVDKEVPEAYGGPSDRPGREPLLKRTPSWISHWLLMDCFFLWAPDSEFPSMQQCLCSSHIPAALCKRGYHSGVAISARNVAIALSSIMTLYWQSAVTHPPSICPQFILHHCYICCHFSINKPASIHSPSILHLYSNFIHMTSHYHPIILNRSTIPPSQTPCCHWLVEHRQTEPGDLNRMESLRRKV